MKIAALPPEKGASQHQVHLSMKLPGSDALSSGRVSLLSPRTMLEQSLHIQDQPVQCSQETSHTQQRVEFVPKGLECFSVFLALCPINMPGFRFLTQDVSVPSETMYSTNSNIGKKPPIEKGLLDVLPTCSCVVAALWWPGQELGGGEGGGGGRAGAGNSGKLRQCEAAGWFAHGVMSGK